MNQVIESLGLNATIFAQMFNFVLVILFIRFVVYPHIIRILEQRQQHIAGNIAQAEEERRKAEELRVGYEAEMKRSREQAQEIIQKATKAGEDQAQEIIDNARNEAGRLKDAALVDIEREKQKAVMELRSQVATLSVLVAGKIIDKKLTDDVQHSMIEEFIKEAGELPC